MAERYGIDVSHHQGVIDWNKVKNAKVNDTKGILHPVEFAIIRIGISYWEGGLKLDNQYDYNMTEAIRVGIPVGVYVYSYTKTVEAIKTTAKLVAEAVDKYGKDIPIFFDLEDTEVYKPLGKKLTSDITWMFLNETKNKYGHPAIVYTYTNFIQSGLVNMGTLCAYPKWIADYRGYCGIAEPDIWQYSSKGSVSGIAGNVDLNVCYNDDLLKSVKPAAYSVKVGMFNKQEDAKEVSDKLTTLGFYNEVKKADTQWYVLSYSYSSKDKADALAWVLNNQRYTVVQAM